MKNEMINTYAELCRMFKVTLQKSNRKAISRIFSAIIYPRTVISKLVLMFYKYMYCDLDEETSAYYEKMLENLIRNGDVLPNKLTPADLRKVMLHIYQVSEEKEERKEQKE